jgi:hypothetical protein
MAVLDPRKGIEDWNAGDFSGEMRNGFSSVRWEATRVSFSTDDLESLLDINLTSGELNSTAAPSTIKVADENPNQNVKTGRGGRKPAHYWPQVAIEFAVYVHDNGFPDDDNQSVVIEHILKMLDSQGHDVAASTIQPIVSDISKRLRNKEN